jgi:membrane-associated protease RseP (regulator of RpoE activity)
LDSLDYWTIGLGVVFGYALVVFLLYRRGLIGPDQALSLLGPALMIKTRRGRGLLDRLGRFRRFWSVAGDLGILLAAFAMVTVVVLLLLDAVIALRVPASAAPPVSEALGIPGINPVIPLGYGIVALVVGVVLHELSHGIVARSQNIGVKTLGILWCVIPIGAFVEQDDVEMNAAPRRHRDRVAAAGVLANFGLAILFFVLLSAAVSTTVQPNASGAGIVYVVPGTPAANASLAAGDIITAVNGTPTPTNAALVSALSNGTPGQKISITYFDPDLGTTITKSITLTSLATYTNQSADRSKGFLGVSLLFLTPTELKGIFVAPYNAAGGPLLGFTFWIVLPLPVAGVEPVQGSVTTFYHLDGPLAGLGTNGFWILANLLYWLAWMNFLLGVSNSLPLLPLDGGLLFRDYTAALAHRLRKGWDSAQLDRFSGRAAVTASLLVVFLIVWQFVAPHL